MDEEQEGEVNVCVAVRCRPMNGKEISEGSSVAIETPGNGQVILTSKKDEKHPYAFDHVFGIDSIQESVYSALGGPLLDKAFEGYNATIFAYGQTGSGKTHSMMNHRAKEAEERGLIPRISEGLYSRIDALTAEHEGRRFLVCCSFLEIYNEIIYDLLVPRAKQAKGGLEVREQKGIGVYVKDLTEMVVENAAKLNGIIEAGFEHRSTAATKMNEGSSRSHCIFIIKLHQKDANESSKNTFSKLNLVDLAGSERAKSTEAEGDRLKEGANINKSLSALGNVINALSSMASGAKKVFVPYRNSKLTRVLSESLGGNSLCTMIAAISPSLSNFDETLSTLNYAKRAKTIKVSATKNDEASQIRKLEDEVEALRRKLAQQAAGEQVGMGLKEKAEMESKYEAQITELQSFMQQSWEEKQRLSEQMEREAAKVKEESAKHAELLRLERKRRMDLLESNSDIQLTLHTLTSLGDKVYSGWPEMISEALKLEQAMRAQLRAVKLFRDSASTDFTSCTGCKVSDAVAVITLLNQVNTKLGSMANELSTLGRLEAELEEKLDHIAPAVGRSLREAQGVATKASADDVWKEEERVEILSLLQKQLSAHHKKTMASLQAERYSMGFGSELAWVHTCLSEDPRPPTPGKTKLLPAIKAAMEGNADGASGGKASKDLTRMLGLSSFELPDARLSSSSNQQASRCARLKQVVLYGGWTPEKDANDQFLEIDCGEELQIIGLSIQGRDPCSSEWTQTRDLLQLALAGFGDKLPSSEKNYKRPPVRLIHDVGVALAIKEGCFKGAGEWFVPDELLNYNDLSREQKVAFFEALIQQTAIACQSAKEGGLHDLDLTPQDILSGKNCEETNRLLQLLSYLALFPADTRATNGLGDVAPQWTKSWKLSYLSGREWKWYGGGGDKAAEKFNGNTDTSTVNFVRLPSPVTASKVRVYPLEWHRHPAIRCEVHVAVEAPSQHGAPLPQAVSNATLAASLALATEGLREVKRGVEERKQALQREEQEQKAQMSALKDKAEQERDNLEERLQKALARVEELEAFNSKNEERATSAETELLKLQAEKGRLESEVGVLHAEVEQTTKSKGEADDYLGNLKEENSELKSQVDDLKEQLQVMTEERDCARQKEEELFDMLGMKDEDLMDTNNGYVYLTERLQEKEEEMEKFQEQFDQLTAAHEKLDERTRELSDEVIKVRTECKALKVKLAEEERMHKAAQDRYMKLLKSNATGRPVSGDTTASDFNATGVSICAASNKQHYEEGFEDEGS